MAPAATPHTRPVAQHRGRDTEHLIAQQPSTGVRVRSRATRRQRHLEARACTANTCYSVKAWSVVGALRRRLTLPDCSVLVWSRCVCGTERRSASRGRAAAYRASTWLPQSSPLVQRESSADDSGGARHVPTYDSCRLVTLTGPLLTYACLASTCWLSITLGALLSADTAGSHFYGGNTAREPRRHTRRGSPHFASPPCRKRRGAARVFALGGGLRATSAGSSRAPTGRDGRGWGACATDLADAIGIAPPL